MSFFFFLSLSIILLLIAIVFNLNQLWPYSFISISLALFFLRVKKHPLKILVKISALFILIHIVVFPLFYLSQLKKNNNSFEFDNYIKNIEKDNAINDIRISLKPDEIKGRLEQIEKLLSDSHNNLYLKLNKIYDSKKIFFLNNFMFTGRINEFEKGPPGSDSMYERSIYVYNTDGEHLIDLSEYIGSIEDTIHGSLFNFLYQEKQVLKTRLSQFENLNHEIEKKEKFWSYSRILPYVINIFNTDNIKPKSRSANILFFIHNFIVVIFIIGLLSSSVHALVNQKKK